MRPFSLPPGWPAARARILRDSLRRGAIAPRLHYETDAQAARWLVVHRRWSPAAAARGRRFYRAALARVAAGFRGRIRVVSLGCGGGAKDLLLLRALRRRGCRAEYVPCDVAKVLVDEAASTCRAAARGCRSMVGDLERPAELARRLNALPRRATPRIVLFLGMLPNLSPTAARRALRAILRPGDTLVASANLLPPRSRDARRVMSQYDNPATRVWLLELPRELGWPSAPAALRFRWGTDPGWRALRRIEGLYRAKSAPRLLLFSSNRHSPAQLRAFAASAGVRATEILVTGARDEGIAWGTVGPGDGTPSSRPPRQGHRASNERSQRTRRTHLMVVRPTGPGTHPKKSRATFPGGRCLESRGRITRPRNRGARNL